MTENEHDVADETIATPEYKKLLAQEQIEFLEKEWHSSEEKATENWDKLLRAMAELENMKRRAERDVSNAHKYALERFIDTLLPVADSLEQALLNCKAGPDDETLRAGLEMTLNMFVQGLGKFGVKVLDPTGHSFDPNLHEAMMQQESADHPHNTVIAVMQKGYLLHDRLVRPARVIVSKGA
ncbi:MAG: nucleotide exchange factor GrpE [Gammaproteobacteria bacterium]|nr:nucleotide exchange factor GrpE [Gammaproteobacteria bacterium]